MSIFEKGIEPIQDQDDDIDERARASYPFEGQDIKGFREWLEDLADADFRVRVLFFHNHRFRRET